MSDFIMPSLGADMTEGLLVAWRVQPGDEVRRGDIIAEVETQKGLFEIEAYGTGIVGPLLVEPGPEKIPVGTVMTTIGESSDASRPVAGSEGRQKISPAARRLAAEQRVDLSRISGTGASGSICLADIEMAVAAQKGSTKQGDAQLSKAPGGDGMRQAIAAAMSLSNRKIPHYYLAEEIDMGRAMDWMEDYNRTRSVHERLLPVVLPLKAVGLALSQTPDLNAHWVDGRLQRKKEVHIGFAIALRNGGLMIPVLHHVDQLSLDALMSAVSDLILRTRSGKLRGSDMMNAGLTVTSLGDLGVGSVFGMIYPPQVGLVGLGRISERPWVAGGTVVARPVLTATLAADHRASDGHLGAQFLDRVNRLLQEPETL